MNWVWDERKSRSNFRKHGVSFEIVHRFDWDLSLGVDVQIVENEVRELWIGPIEYQLFSLVFTVRKNETRVISLRPATKYEKDEWKHEFQR